MGDMGEVFNAMKREDARRRERNLQSATDDGGWKKHTAYHWSRDLNGDRLDFWPSRNRFHFQGRTHTGDVRGFIRRREASPSQKGGE